MDTTIAASVLTWAQGHAALSGLPVGHEELPAEGVNAAMVSSLSGDPFVKRFKSGGYIAAYPFQVILRVNGADTAARLAAMSTLSDIAASIETTSTWPVAPAGYDYMAFELRTLPAPIAADDSGVRDYQITFELTYRKG